MAPTTRSHTGFEGIDATSMRHAGRELLSLALMDARNHALHLLAQFEPAALPAEPPPRMQAESPLWIAGQIGWLAEYWTGRNPQRALGPVCPADAPRLSSLEPLADAWFDPALATAGQRWGPGPPGAESVRSYLLQTLESTLELLEKTPDSDDALYFYRVALFHEDLRCEQLAVLAQALAVPLKLPLPGAVAAREPLLVPAGMWRLGWGPAGFACDIERPAHEVAVPQFEIDAQPVNWSQYVEFVQDGGYDRAELWQPQGWEWLAGAAAREGRRAPRYVEQIGGADGAVLATQFGLGTRLASQQSVRHVSWWEADAWARWAGRRLPTEVEWELAAHAAQRRGFHWGDVREWTATTLRPWPGYVADCWSRHTPFEAQPLFGRARVQRGACFAARARMKHPRFRGFALPERDDAFVGFRTCSL